jgi:hypothetical protein
MKKFIFSWVVLFFIGCSNDDEMEQQMVGCIEMEENESFEQIEFKENYTIQMPVGHSGVGLEELLGTRFESTTTLRSKFYYQYLCDVDCAIYFGENLESPVPDQVVWSSQLPMIILDSQVEFCHADDVKAILYYNSNSSAMTNGKLFMKVDLDFKEGLLIDFDINNLDEVKSVIKTIINS